MLTHFLRMMTARRSLMSWGRIQWVMSSAAYPLREEGRKTKKKKNLSENNFRVKLLQCKQQFNQCMTGNTDSPEHCDTASPYRQHKHRLGHPDGFELEAAAEAQRAVTEEGHRDNGPCEDVQRINM